MSFRADDYTAFEVRATAQVHKVPAKPGDGAGHGSNSFFMLGILLDEQVAQP